MFDSAQSYIVDKVENLLIELACDRYLTIEEFSERTNEVIKLVITKEAKQSLVDKIEIRDEMNGELSPYKIIIREILSKQ
jgi:hypothetical protein